MLRSHGQPNITHFFSVTFCYCHFSQKKLFIVDCASLQDSVTSRQTAQHKQNIICVPLKYGFSTVIKTEKEKRGEIQEMFNSEAMKLNKLLGRPFT